MKRSMAIFPNRRGKSHLTQRSISGVGGQLQIKHVTEPFQSIVDNDDVEDYRPWGPLKSNEIYAANEDLVTIVK